MTKRPVNKRLVNERPVSERVLAVRLDSAGDVLLAGPAIRAMAASAQWLSLWVSPLGREPARLLPGVDDVIVWDCPWISGKPPAVDPAEIETLVATLRAGAFDQAVIFTSFHQSPLPTALLLRLAGVPWIGAISVDYPGSLLDLRHQVDDDIHEVERALDLAAACGFGLPPGDPGALQVARSPDSAERLVPAERYVVLHPGTSVPARAWPVQRFTETAALFREQGRAVVVTGSPSEASLTAEVAAGTGAYDLGGRTSLRQLADVLAGADVVVSGNTGPAHLAAAVGTPIVSLFAPTVPAVRWAPYGVQHVVLGDQSAPCRDTRVTHCPVPGHPCLTSVTALDVLRAAEKLTISATLPPTHRERPGKESPR